MASSDNKEAAKGDSFIVTTRGLASVLAKGCLSRKSSTIASQPTSRSVLSVKASGNSVKERFKISVAPEVHNSLIESLAITIWSGRVIGFFGPEKGSEFQ